MGQISPGRYLLVGIELVKLGMVAAAIPVVGLGVVLTSRGLAAFGLAENGSALQLFPAVMPVDLQAGGAEEKEKSEDNMSNSDGQMRIFHVQVRNKTAFPAF
jgi:hypothetical protein